MEIVYDNLPKGLASTYGAFIRKVLYNTDIATAIVGIRINNGDVSNIFTSVDNVVQDVLQIVTALQDTYWDVEGEYALATYTGQEIKTGDFNSHQINALAPDTTVATCIGGSQVTIEFILRKAKGKQSEQQNKLWAESNGLTGFIYLASFHRNIKKANAIVKENNDLTETLIFSLDCHNGKEKDSLAHVVNALDELKDKILI